MLVVQSVSKEFTKAGRILALDAVSFTVSPGEAVAVVGASGSGKTTLLRIVACHLTPDSGKLFLDGEGLPLPSTAAGARFRSSRIGLVPQDLSLIERETAVANVALPLRLAGVSRRKAELLAMEQLALRGLDGRARAPVNALSGGQRQRVALARALVTSPRLLIADEPTGSLDGQQVASVIDDMLAQAAQGRGVLIATHDQRVWERCGRAIRLEDGRVVG